jgi:hypothetical protein
LFIKAYRRRKPLPGLLLRGAILPIFVLGLPVFVLGLPIFVLICQFSDSIHRDLPKNLLAEMVKSAYNFLGRNVRGSAE